MTKYLYSAALLFSFGKALVPSHAAAQDPELCNLALDAVLDRYLTVRGGAAALDNLEALRIISKNHEGRWNPDFDYQVMKPSYMLMTATYVDGVVIREGYDGKRAWEKLNPDEPAKFVAGDSEKGLAQGGQSPVMLYGLHQMAGFGHTVTLKGCESIDGINFYVINVLATFGTDIDYYLNSTSFLLERARAVRPLHPSIDPTKITIEERWDDFRFVDGVLYPFRYFTWDVDNKRLLTFLEVKEIMVDTEVTSKAFALPEG